MGFILSVVYLLTNYLTPPVLFGSLAEVHVEIVLAVLITLISIPQIMRSFVFKTPQALALGGLAVAVFLSVLIGVGWPGGAARAVLEYLPNMYAFFLIGLHCNSRRRLQVLVLMLLFVCLFVIANGMRDLRYANSSAFPTGTIIPDDANFVRLEIEHPYVIHMSDDEKKVFYRVRGLGEINDPNDFGQILVCEIPLLFIFWRPKKLLRNLTFVIVPRVCLAMESISHIPAGRWWLCWWSYWSRPAAASGHCPPASLRLHYLPEPWRCILPAAEPSQRVLERIARSFGEKACRF